MRPLSSWRRCMFAERKANQIRRISSLEFLHHPGAMTFERPRADLHPQGALLVGTSLTDMAQNLPLPRGQKRMDGLRGSGVCDPGSIGVAAALRAAAPCPPVDHIAAKLD